MKLEKLKFIGLAAACAVMVVACGGKSSGNPDSSPSVSASATPEDKTQENATPTATFTPTPSPTPTKDPELLDVKPEVKIPDLTDTWNDYNEKPAVIEGIMRRAGEAKTQPCINITTYRNTEIKSKEEYVGAIIDVFNCDEEFKLTAGAGVKVRGNSTAKDKPYPYRIKFESKQNLLGLHDGEAFKSWVLLKPMWNCNPDYLAHSVYNAMTGDAYYGSDDCLVNLYVNGKYLGIYTLCEQNQATDGRVEIYEPKEDERRTDIGYFLELDNNASDEEPYFNLDYGGVDFTDMLGETRKMPVDSYTIKSDIYTVSQYDFIAKYLAGVHDIMYAACENKTALMFDENYDVVSAEGVYTPEQAVEAVMDLDSAVYMLLLYEFTQDYDVGAGSFNFAVDFSEGAKYDKLTFLAPWDFNWAYYENANSNYYAATWQKLQDKWDRSNTWFMVLMKADWFRARVIDKLNKLIEDETIEKEIKVVETEIEKFRNDYDNEGWKVDKGKELCQFVRNRIKFLTKNLKVEM